MTAATASGLTIDETAALTRQVTRLSVVVAAVLSVIKAIAWLNSDSVSMLASLADSSLDLVASLVTYFAVRYAAAPPDREHRYGHGKAEAFASLVQAGLVFASAALVGREAIEHIAHPTVVSNGGWSLVVMAVSILMTGGLILAQSRVLKRANSIAVSGDRTHYAADLASNIVALIGMKDVRTGHTLCAEDDPLVFESLRIPEPVISPESGIRESWAMPHQLGLPVFHFHASAGASRRLTAEA